MKKKLPQLIEESDSYTTEKIKKAVVFIDGNLKKEALLENLSILLNISISDIVILAVQTKPFKEKDEEWMFDSKDFGWFGKIKSDKLKYILTKKYDLLINYSKVDMLYTNLVLLRCKAGFKVGFGHLDSGFYDLIINCEPDDLSAFNKELKKYLQILKKI